MRLTYWLLIGLFLACKPSATDTAEEVVEDTVVTESKLSDEMVNPSLSQQQLNNFMVDFNSSVIELPQIFFEHSDEMSIIRIQYLLEGNELSWLRIEEAGEGGFEEETILKIDEESPAMYYSSSEQSGFFKYTLDGEQLVVSIVKTESMIRAQEPAEGFDIEYLGDYYKHLSKIKEKRNLFELGEGKYKVQILLRKYKGEYGDAQEEEKYEVTEALFKSDLLSGPFIPNSKIEPFQGKWYPLFQNDNGDLERRSTCQSERYILIDSKLGKYIWQENDPLSGMELEVVSVKHGTSETANISIANGSYKQTMELILRPKENLMLINNKPYTSEPDQYKLVDDSKNCNEGE